jgi:hypothetical protein
VALHLQFEEHSLHIQSPCIQRCANLLCLLLIPNPEHCNFEIAKPILDNLQVHREKFITLFLQPILWEHDTEGFHDLRVREPLLQLTDKKLGRSLALALHDRHGNVELLLAHRLSHSSDIISQVSWVSVAVYAVSQSLRSRVVCASVRLSVRHAR